MIEDYVTSCIEGRIRLRHSALQEPENAQLLKQFLAALPGMQNVAVNPRTGSLLLEYDPEKLSMRDLLELASGWEEQAATSEPCRPLRKDCSPLALLLNRRMLNRGMLALLGASLVAGMAGRTGVHVATGGLFVLFNALHVYTWRKCL